MESYYQTSYHYDHAVNVTQAPRPSEFHRNQIRGGGGDKPRIPSQDSSLETAVPNGPCRIAESSRRTARFRVGNVENRGTDEVTCLEERDKKKYLTAKYGQHQMHLIKKRLTVESWIYGRLQEISKEIGTDLDAYDIDIDDVLDIEDVCDRKIFLQKHFRSVRNHILIRDFIHDILSKIEIL